MYLPFLIINLILVVAANPLHKYPSVFLLDVGNEEIKNTASEQIRITVPGGSLAIKYPAVNGDDTISHVRVSGIDFGTDLKANIVEGGPGSNFVVLAFMGNPGVTYDAVITIDLVDNSVSAAQDGENNSAEDLNDQTDSSVGNGEKSSRDTAIASSNVYTYASNLYEANYKDDEQGDDSDGDTVEDNEDESDNDDNQESSDDSPGNDSQDDSSDKTDLSSSVKSNYVSYESFKPRLYGGVRIYPQAGLYVDDTDSRPAYDPENHEVDESAYDDRSVDFTNSNNNIKLEYTSVVE